MATGDSMVVFDATSVQPAGTDPSTLDSRNSRLVMDFSQSVDRSAIFSAVLPNNYEAGGLDVAIEYGVSSGTGNVKWDVSFERMLPGTTNVDTDSFASVQTLTEAVPASTLTKRAVVSFTNAQIDGLLKNESYRVKVTRNGLAAGDTLLGDVELHKIYITEQ